MATTTKPAIFGEELFEFLADLQANNNREWFAANRRRYEEHLLEPALDFIEAFAPRLEEISPHFRAELGKDAHAPAFYLHIGTDEVGAAAGMWHPPTDVATRIREAIVERPQ